MKKACGINGKNSIKSQLNEIVDNLCEPGSYSPVYHSSKHESPMPSLEELSKIVNTLRSIMLPGYFGNSEVKPETMQYYLGASIDSVFLQLSEQVRRGFCFFCEREEDTHCTECDRKGRNISVSFLEKLQHIRYMLTTDVKAAYEGDPAARHFSEAIFCYPSIKAMTNYRIAHELFKLDVPLIPRIITEMAHSETGIDIHPGASIDEGFFMDHGTGIVIGETCVIGKNVRLYQGVTLGAKHFPLGPDGNPIKGVPRHPIVQDDVIIYSGATILGRITIGKGAVIGGNVWLTHDIPPGARVLQGKLEEFSYEDGGGI